MSRWIGVFAHGNGRSSLTFWGDANHGVIGDRSGVYYDESFLFL